MYQLKRCKFRFRWQPVAEIELAALGERQRDIQDSF